MPNQYTVTQVTSYIRNMFAQDFVLRSVLVSGEVSNCKYHTSGHIYFTIKDEKAALACVMFAGKRNGLAFRLENGQQVVVKGSVSVFEKNGSYQLYAEKITLDGAGLLAERFEQLKAELKEQGMFDPCYKQPIPKYIKKLGVVTAPTGAAIRDIISVTKRRNPYVRIILYPAIVQGPQAAPSIVRGIETLQMQDVDVIIVGRGGGSMEDLWAFNEREVAQAIFDCPIPIISAVGHEIDYSISDFVADMRAATPSAGAELAVYEADRVLMQAEDLRERLGLLMNQQIAAARKQTEAKATSLTYLSPGNRLREKKQEAARLCDRLQSAMNAKIREWQADAERGEEQLKLAMEHVLQGNRHRLELMIRSMKGLSPLDKLNQGFSYTADAKGKTIRSIEQMNPGDEMEIYVSDGKIRSVVQETISMSWEKRGNGHDK